MKSQEFGKLTHCIRKEWCCCELRGVSGT